MNEVLGLVESQWSSPPKLKARVCLRLLWPRVQINVTWFFYQYIAFVASNLRHVTVKHPDAPLELRYCGINLVPLNSNLLQRPV